MSKKSELARLAANALPLIRYGLVGLVVNMLGYLVYLGVTWLGVSPKITVTLFYPVAVLSGYFLHARYSFGYQGKTRTGLVRYGLAHVVGYLTNIGLLFLFVDLFGYPHEAVQLVAIFIVAGQLFLIFRFFVFKTRSSFHNVTRAASVRGS